MFSTVFEHINTASLGPFVQVQKISHCDINTFINTFRFTKMCGTNVKPKTSASVFVGINTQNVGRGVFK